jgi:hypothetical protein
MIPLPRGNYSFESKSKLSETLVRKPRLIYDNDVRHHLTYRYDPPLSIHRLRQPVDEIVGTPVDTLFYGFVYRQTQPHPARVGLWWVWDEGERSQIMWWRGGENLKQSLGAGRDPLKIAVDRGHEHGLNMLTWLVWEPEDPDNPVLGTYRPHTPEAQEERLDVIEAACDDYEFDGIGLNYYVGPKVFSAEVGYDSSAPKDPAALTEFVRKVRRLLDRIGEKRGRELTLAAQVHPVEAANAEAGLEVGTWLSEGLVNLLIPCYPHANNPEETSLLDTNPSIGWMVEAAHRAGALVYAPIAGSPYDDVHHATTLEMHRAAATNLRAIGVDGIYMSNIHWPHGPEEYHLLREMGYPDLYARRTKQYRLGMKAAQPGPFTESRQLPITLEEGMPATLNVFVGDDLDSARADGELVGFQLIVRILQVCHLDKIRFDVNEREYTLDQAENEWAYGGSVSYTAQRGGLPLRITSYNTFTLDLPVDAIQHGDNRTAITLETLHRDLLTDRVLHAVDVRVIYDEPPIPQGGQM